MNITDEDKDLVQECIKKLNYASGVLKQEFVGIDDIIDKIIDLIKPFYIFPNLLQSPLVINLWGLTGVGKTSLVYRMMDLLGLNNRLIKFDIGEYSSAYTDRMKDQLSSGVENTTENNNYVFVLDEFQRGRTVSNDYQDVDRQELSVMWDLIDTGKISLYWRSSGNRIMRCLNIYKHMLERKTTVQNGYVYGINKKFIYQILSSLDETSYECDYERRKGVEYKFDSAGNRYVKINKTKWVEDNMSPVYNIGIESTENETDDDCGISILPLGVLDLLIDINPGIFGIDSYDDYFVTSSKYHEIQKTISSFSLKQFIKYIEDKFAKQASMMKEYDYSKSLIFCIGNLDNLYTMSSEYNPDSDADLFYLNSLKITLPQVKEELSRYFKPEQIGRLGNNHIIYPALKKEHYEKIIQINLDKKINEYKNSFGIDMEFDNTINDIIYKEGVFPSQGVRPIISTIKALIDSYAVHIISDIMMNGETVDKITWTFDRESKKYCICYNNNKLTYPVQLQIENLRESVHSDEQFLTSVHEAGHAVISCVMANLAPKEVRSRTASNLNGFCLIEYPEIETKDIIEKKICVLLGGIESERLLLGEKYICSGAKNDLYEVTKLAARMVKLYGMFQYPYQITLGDCACNVFSDKHTLESEMCISKIINNMKTTVQLKLQEYKPFLIELVRVLSSAGKISNEEITDMASKYCINIKSPNKYYSFDCKIFDNDK